MRHVFQTCCLLQRGQAIHLVQLQHAKQRTRPECSPPRIIPSHLDALLCESGIRESTLILPLQPEQHTPSASYFGSSCCCSSVPFLALLFVKVVRLALPRFSAAFTLKCLSSSVEDTLAYFMRSISNLFFSSRS